MQGHSIAINGLTVARQSLEVVGNNLANAATEGYHRQEAMVAPLSGDPLARIPIGYGAEVTQIRRAADLLLETQIWNHRPELGQTEEELATLEALESVLGDMTTGGLATALGDFFQALQTSRFALTMLPKERLLLPPRDILTSTRGMYFTRILCLRIKRSISS